jgi:hypothetical protein
MQPYEQIKPTSLPLKRIFGAHLYSVPDNQRQYSWKADDQLPRLWEDLIASIRSDRYPALRDSRVGHYLGAIVLIGSDERERLQIIDGQQRMTSIMILSRCLLDTLKSDEAIATQTYNHRRMLEDMLSEAGPEPKPRVTLNRENWFFASAISETKGAEERNHEWAEESIHKGSVRRSLVEAFNFFYTAIESYLESAEFDRWNRPQRFEALVETLCEDFYALWIRVNNTRMAYRLFETLNERGLELSQADLIRNAVLESASRDSGADFKKCVQIWNEMLESLEAQSKPSLSTPELIQFSYSSRHNQVEAEKTFDQISETLRLGQLAAVDFMGELQLDSMNWTDFLQGNLTFWTDPIINSRHAITEPLWKKHCVPLVLAVAEKWNDRKNIEDFKSALWCIECYLFRQGLIVGESVGSLQKVFSKAAIETRRFPDVRALRKTLKDHSPTESFIASFATARVNNMKQSFYVAWRIEEYLRERERNTGVDFTPAKQSPAQHLEHIMPRKPDSSWQAIENDEDFNVFKNRLGNHCVLEAKINSSVKNSSFKEKIFPPGGRLGYSDSELMLPKEIVEKKGVWFDDNKWTFESIKARQQHLADQYAASVWDFDRF